MQAAFWRAHLHEDQLGALPITFFGGPVFAQATDVPLLIEGCQGCHGAAGQGGHGIPAIEGTHSRDEFAALMRAHYKPQENIMALSRRAFLAAANFPQPLPRRVASPG